MLFCHYDSTKKEGKSMLIKIALYMMLGWGMLHAGQEDLQSKIARLQHAPKTERFKLMNEIKRELARLNAEQRNKALSKLRGSMKAKGASPAGQANRYMKGGMQGDGTGRQMQQNMQNRMKKQRQQMQQTSPGNGK